MFKCNLTGAAYTYENMNLLELRTKMLQQFGLKPWDIYAGYSEKSIIIYKEKEIVVSDVATPWKVQLATNISKRITERDARLQQDKDALSTELKQLDTEILAIAKAKTGKDFNTYAEYKSAVGFNTGVPTPIIDKRNEVSRAIDGFKRGYNTNKYKVTVTPEDLNLFEDELLFVSTHSTYGRSSVLTAETLLDSFDYRQMVCILDYCEKNKLSNEEKLLAFKVDTTQEYAVRIDEFNYNDYPELINVRPLYSNNYEYSLYKRVPHEEIYNYILTELNLYAERVVKVDRAVYYQQVDITPITMNITAEGKLELIDGYKRLLYVNDPELLNVDAPIKVFKELSDEHFIRLLYSANAWKTVSGRGVAPFHDRGYIFALRQRFGIRFEDYFHDTWKDIDLLELLQLYDAPSKYCLYNKYLVSDMKALAHLDLIEMSFFKNESNEIYHRMIKTSIRILGEMRRNNLDVAQKNIDFNKFLEKVLSDKAFAKKLASKENLSVGGHIDNFIVEHVKPVLIKAMETTLLGNV